VKPTTLLDIPLAFTDTFPLVTPTGMGASISVSVHSDGVTAVELMDTVPGDIPKEVP
jgi:hypothetical protein